MSEYPITAFPTTEANWINENVRTEGMTLRDHFAGKAWLASLYLSMMESKRLLLMQHTEWPTQCFGRDI